MARYGDEFYGLSLYGTETLVDFDVSPFVASSVDYNKILITWATPTGDWDQLRLVRNGFGFPVTPDDGDLLFTGTPSSVDQSYVDEGQVPNNSGLIEGRTYYYAMFVREATTRKWVSAGNALGVAVKNYGTANLMYEYLPAVYRIGNPYTAEDNASQVNTDLYNFLQIFAFEYDFFKTTAENIKNRYNPLTLDGRLVPALLNQFGFNYEAEIGLQQARILLKNAIKIYSERGSLSGLKTFVTAFTGFNSDVLPVTNLMLDYNNSTFIESIGFWESLSNATLARATITTESPAVPPYAEEASASNFPNSQIGFLKVTATAAADALIACGASAPLTRGIPVTAGATYALTAYIRSKNVARSVLTNIYWYDRFGQLIGTAGEATTLSVVEEWNRTNVSTGSAPENAYYAVPEIRIEDCAASEVHYIDAVQFEAGAEPTTFVDARRIDVVLRANRINQVLNPSFEASLDNWLFQSGEETQTLTVTRELDGAVEGSNYSAKMVTSEDNQVVIVTSVEKVSVQGADQNALSAYVKGDMGSTAKLSIVWFDQSDEAIFTATTAEVNLMSSEWSRLEVTAISPADAVTATISVEFNTATAGTEIFMDAVLFEKAAFVSPYFDGDSGYAELGDTLWEQGDPVNSRSHYYKNREVVVKRLLKILPDYLPAGAPWAVFVATAD